MRRILLAAAVLSTVGCASSRIVEDLRPTVRSVTPRITGIDLRGVNLAFDLDVANPLPVAIRTPRFRYGIEIAGASLASAREAQGLDLPASGAGTATLPVRLDFADIWRIARGLSDAKEFDYRVSGALLLSALGRNFELPFSHSGKAPVLRPPSFRAVSVAPPEVSISGATIAIDAEVSNPNLFGLGIERLGYGLRAGEIDLGGLTASTGGEVPAGGVGQIRLTGRMGLDRALLQALGGMRPGAMVLRPVGSVTTPYGAAVIGE